MPAIVAIHYKHALQDLDAAKRRQIPYAVARALTDTAFDARASIQQKMPSVFTIRRQWVIRGVRVDRATKSTAKHGFLEAAVKHLDEHMAKQERGGTVQRRSRAIAIPGAKLRKSKRRSIPKSRKPAALLRNPRYFVGDDQTGRPIIYQRVGRKRLRPMYLLRNTAKYRPIYGFEATVRKVTNRRFRGNFGRALARAIATAR